MRTLNSLKNIVSGIGGQIISVLLKFISRTVFIYVLGKEYLGIEGLFTNILGILSIAELGIGTAIVYSLYKPLAEIDMKRTSAILNFLKRAYFLVSCVILVIGLILMPFLPYIITGTTDLVDINLIYILYVFQSASSYWFSAYKGSMLQADQKKYILNFIRYLVNVITTVFQIIILLLFESFVIYTIIGILSNLAINLITAKKVDKMYPYILTNKKETLLKDEKKDIFKNVFGASLYRINSTIVRSTDNIVISAFISTVAVGIYSNYHLIINTIITIAKMIFSSIAASIGNLYASESKEKNYFIFKTICFFSFWFYGFFAICLWILLNPFITLWLNQEFLLANFTVLIIVIDFLMDGYQQVSITYKDACGLFWYGRYRPVATAILNIIISIYLASRMGISGVLLGTILSRLFTTWWFEPYMIYKYAFHKKSNEYFIKYIAFLILVFIVGALVSILCLPFSKYNIWNFLIKVVICLVVPNTIFFILFRRTEEFKYLFKIGKSILKFIRTSNSN